MNFIPCRTVELTPDRRSLALRLAVEHNPHNALHGLGPAAPAHLAVYVGKYWRPGTTLTVGFLESTPADLQARILAHMNAWNTQARANIRFALASSPQIRITRAGDGYWSYIGTDLLSIPAGQPTMCLQGFTMNTPEGEYRRVVRHETGHSIGFPHEHSRREIVNLLDPARTIRYFEESQGWSESTIREQILTSLDERSLMGTPHAEQDSIMCYQFPGACTRSGQPIPGGVDITPADAAFSRSVFPGLVPTMPTPPRPPIPPRPPTAGAVPIVGMLADESLAFALNGQGYRLAGPFHKLGRTTYFDGLALRVS